MKALRILKSKNTGAIDHLSMLRIAQQIDLENRKERRPDAKLRTNHNQEDTIEPENLENCI